MVRYFTLPQSTRDAAARDAFARFTRQQDDKAKRNNRRAARTLKRQAGSINVAASVAIVALLAMIYGAVLSVGALGAIEQAERASIRAANSLCHMDGGRVVNGRCIIRSH